MNKQQNFIFKLTIAFSVKNQEKTAKLYLFKKTVRDINKKTTKIALETEVQTPNENLEVKDSGWSFFPGHR